MKSAEFTLEAIRQILSGEAASGSGSGAADQAIIDAAAGFGLGKDFGWRLAREGRIFYASAAAQDTKTTGQTSLAATTPTLMLRNPAGSGKICLPLFWSVSQAGTVAGGVVSVVAEIDNVDRYSSSGSDATVLCSRPVNPHADGNECGVKINPTASSGYGVRVYGQQSGQDVEPAEGAIQEHLWTPTSGPDILDEGSCLCIYAWAASTAPSLYWTIKWAEVTEELLALVG